MNDDPLQILFSASRPACSAKSVHHGSNNISGSSTGGGVAMWVFCDDDAREASRLGALSLEFL